jgi:ubiquinone/menaquinone biosynthesis C-methylase UbiE
MTILYPLAGCVVAVVLIRHFAPELYDFSIVHMTERWYAAVLADLDLRVRGAPVTVLDVGVGTATALVRNRQQIVGSKMRFVGVDYDAAYIVKAKAKVAEAGLSDRVQLHCGSFFDAALLGRLLAENADAQQFDAAYFSGSLTLLPSPLEALNVCRTVVKPGGLVYITQTFQRVGFPGLGYIKPLLWLFTTIDFGTVSHACRSTGSNRSPILTDHCTDGFSCDETAFPHAGALWFCWQLTYETELEHLLERAEGLTVLQNDVVPGSVNNRFQVRIEAV